MLEQGLLIVVEGADGTGKSTQANLLQERLQKNGFQVIRGKHPNKETPFGQIVYRYLAGEFGPINTLPVELIFELYSLDRYSFKLEYEQALKDGKIILLDRYIESGIAYQGSLFQGKDKERFIQWMKEVESRMPQANAIIFLDLPSQVNEKLLKKKDEKGEDREYLKKSGKKKDIQEEQTDLQEKVRQSYLKMASEEQRFIMIDCVKKNFNDIKIRSIEEIHREIWEKIEGLINQQKLLKWKTV